MTGSELKKARLGAGWTQQRLAKHLGMTQAYLSLMEAGKRPVPDRVTRRATSLFGLQPTSLPLNDRSETDPVRADLQLEQGLARLGYPGLAWRKKPGALSNPVELLLKGLVAENPDPRLAEALPWLLLKFEGYTSGDLVARAKHHDVQNRLGFTVALARRVAEHKPEFRSRLEELQLLERLLEHFRLAREDTYGRKETSERMRTWLRENRSLDAAHWNLLTDLKPEHLPYA